jgi:hypothetical protein
LQCSVVDLGVVSFLTCSAGSDSTFELCPAGTMDDIYPIGGVAIASAQATGCQQLTFEVIPQCIVTAPPPQESWYLGALDVRSLLSIASMDRRCRVQGMYGSRAQSQMWKSTGLTGNGSRSLTGSIVS